MLEKISESDSYCTSKEHYPPSNPYLEPGLYKWTCPKCGYVTLFNVASFSSNVWTKEKED